MVITRRWDTDPLVIESRNKTDDVCCIERIQTNTVIVCIRNLHKILMEGVIDLFQDRQYPDLLYGTQNSGSPCHNADKPDRNC